MNNYVPREGSVAARAIESLRVVGPATASVLADRLNIDSVGIPSVLERAMERGLVKREKLESHRWTYSIGDGKPVRPVDEPMHSKGIDMDAIHALARSSWPPRGGSAPPEEPPDEEDPEPPAAAPAAPPEPPRQVRELVLQADGVGLFSCALFSDGRLVIELGTERMTLAKEHVRDMFKYLDHFGRG